jgi:hypothetical protein
MRKAPEKGEGDFDIAKLDAWTLRYHGALSVLPSLQNKIADLRGACLNHEAAVAHGRKLKEDFGLSPAPVFKSHYGGWKEF